LIPGQKTRLGIGLVLIWSYAAMVGAEPPVLRAVLMLSIHLIGRELARSHSGANGLGAAVLGMLAWQPPGLFDPGFQLSFLAVAVIVVWVVPLGERLRAIGGWQPTVATPFPPQAPRLVRWAAELLFWDGARFQREMRRERIRYRLPKAPVATWLSRRRLQSVLRAIGLGLLSTTLIQVALLPLMIDRFHRVSLLSPAINLIESALITILMVGGALEVGLHVFLWAAGEENGWCSQVGWAHALGELGDWSVRIGEAMARWPGGSLRPPGIPGIGPLLFLVYGGALLVLLWRLQRWNPLGPPQGGEERKRSRRATGLVVGASLLLFSIPLVFLLPLVPHARPVGRLSLTFLDVGQGDAILASFPDRQLMLIDSGGDARLGRTRDLLETEPESTFEEDQPGIAEMAVMPFLWVQGVRRLDRIVGTHDHEDHIGGFATLVRNFSVGEAWQGGGEEGRFREMAGGAGIPLRRLGTGETFEIGGVRVESLFVADPRRFRSPNDRSLVLRLTYGEHRFLLPGDLEAGAEEALLAAGLDPAAEVLKVGHHGSRTSSTVPFLDRVGARIAIISAGSPSPFGHPHPEVLDRLDQRGVRVYRTSACGAITLSTDGKDLSIETTVPCHPAP
jgi:competence protein ComEC